MNKIIFKTLFVKGIFIIIALCCSYISIADINSPSQGIATILSNSETQRNLNIRIVSPTGNTVSKPLPVNIDGVIENFAALPVAIQNSLHLYVAQKNQGEAIFHVQPEFVISSDGNFGGQVWLGSVNFGNGEYFELHFILTQVKIPLVAGDNPMKNLPPQYYSQKFILKRND